MVDNLSPKLGCELLSPLRRCNLMPSALTTINYDVATHKQRFRTRTIESNVFRTRCQSKQTTSVHLHLLAYPNKLFSSKQL